MTGKIPARYKLADTIDRAVYDADEYENWTVADLIEILGDYPQGAPVFHLDSNDEDAETLRPVEFVSGGPDGVIL